MNAPANLFDRDALLLAAYGLALILLLVLTIALVRKLIQELNHGDVPRIESHWGGIGGGLGGWELSRSLVYLIASVSFAVLTVVVLRAAAKDLQPTNTGSQQQASTGPPSETANGTADKTTPAGTPSTPANTPVPAATPPPAPDAQAPAPPAAGAPASSAAEPTGTRP